MHNCPHLLGAWLVFIVGDKTKKTKDKKQNSVELEASLAPAEAEVGALAKADQKIT